MLRFNEYVKYEHTWKEMGKDVGYMCEYNDWF